MGAAVQPGRIGLILSVSWIALVVLLALAADFLPLQDPTVDAEVGIRVPPLQSLGEPLGTDGFGRSMLARAIFGARASLAAGIGAAAAALLIGLAIGVAAGYFRGKVDTAIGIAIDALLSFPGIVVLVVVGATIGGGVGSVTLGLAIVAVPLFARLARANTLRVAPLEYVLAARGLGASPRKVVFLEIVPNVLTSMIAYAGVVVGVLILAESSVSFLGLGVQLPQPSWGNMISEGQKALRTDPHLVLVPAALLVLTILALNQVAEYVRSRSDTSSRL
ncbi:ABC transporter permease [Nocardioides sp. Root190]|uniref:ABC transporter permease n=1 Tax=Nocardioides sp. Root190 TaxID=1736488 RepID=UPI0007000665|nr:ABC transporter permease [Nocardioides sp. Root190]KRB75147.1 ABC transporter permease [Nocardioides sp. Root190]